MIVNGFFPIGEIPFQEGTNDGSDNEGGAQGGDFSMVLFLILADPAAKSAQIAGDLEPSLPPVTSDGGSSAGSVLPQSPGSSGANQDVIDVPAKPANPQAVNLAQEFTGEQTAPTAHRPGDGGARTGIAANVPGNLLPRSVTSIVGQSANGQPNGVTVTMPNDLVSKSEILEPEVVSAVTPPAHFPDHLQQPIRSQSKNIRVVLDTAKVTSEANPPSADARLAGQNAPRQSQGIPLDDSVWVNDSLDDLAVRREHIGPGDEVVRLGRQLPAPVINDSHGRILSETIGRIGNSGSPDPGQGHPGLNLQYGIRAPFPEPPQAPNDLLQQGGAPYHAPSLTGMTSKAIAREVEPGRWLALLEQVAGEINGHIRIGKQEAIMQLDPPELGKLRIDLHLDGDRLEARILAETPESRAIIETHLPELRRILGENRVELVEVRIDSGSWSSAGGEGHGWPRQEANGGYQPTNDFGSVVPMGAEERELEPRQPQPHEPGRVSMWA